MTAYCPKCRVKVEMQKAHEVTMMNGKPAHLGRCPLCGGKVWRAWKRTFTD